MKSLLLFFVFATSLSTCGSEEETKTLSYQELIKMENQQNDSLLVDIQEKIDAEFEKSFVNGNTEGMDNILLELDKIDSPISKYWSAYSKYYLGIYYISNEDPEQSEEKIKEAIKILEKNSKSTEGYALLGTLLNFSVQFSSGFKSGLIGSKAKKNFNKALELEPKNLRAYLGLASLDYYTPEKYGGKKETVKYVTKALEQPDQAVANPMLPSWGRDSAYIIIISYYIYKENLEKAKEYYKKAIEKFPNNYQLNSLSKKLI